MKLLLTLLLLPQLFASNILSYKLYDRSDRFDIMLTFDTPYEGNIRQFRQSGKIIIKLEDASIESPKMKQVSSPFLTKLTITPIDQETQVIVSVPDDVNLFASKTSDAYGLRLRFAKSTAAAAETAQAQSGVSSAPLSALPTKVESELTQSYAVVIAILVIGILIMFYLKRKVTAPSSSTANSKPWIFGSKSGKSADNVSIRFQKAIDQKNRVVMMDYGEESYLVVIGNTNLMLDKFHGNKPVTQNEFESMLKEKNEELDAFLQLEREKKQEAFESYKAKASGIDYDA